MATLGSYHLVRTSSGVVWVSRVAIGWNDLFVDVREWRAEDWRQHPQLSQAVLRSGRRDLLPQGPRLHPGHQWAVRAFRGQQDGPPERQ